MVVWPDGKVLNCVTLGCEELKVLVCFGVVKGGIWRDRSFKMRMSNKSALDFCEGATVCFGACSLARSLALSGRVVLAIAHLRVS